MARGGTLISLLKLKTRRAPTTPTVADTRRRHTYEVRRERGVCLWHTIQKDIRYRSINGQGQVRSLLRHSPTEGETPGEQTRIR